MPPPDDDALAARSACTSRLLPHPPEQVYHAFAQADLLAAWWGPEGFQNHFEVFDFRPGGRWVFVMQGPDGTRYPNENLFQALVPGRQVVLRHVCAPLFTLTVDLQPEPGGTRLVWSQVFDDVRTAQAVMAVVVPANEQNLDRLGHVLASAPGPAAPAPLAGT